MSCFDLGTNEWTGTICATQQLYSEGSRDSYTVEEYLQCAREYGRDSVKLDIIFTASTVYLDAARRNVQLIFDSYVQGIISIIDLLDAQNQEISAERDMWVKNLKEYPGVQ